MKKLIFMLLILGQSGIGNAQILLEKKFTGAHLNAINLSSTYYYSTDMLRSKISIYKENFTFLKTVTLLLPSNYYFDSATLSDKVFDNSTDIEFLVLVYKKTGSSADPDASMLLLYNEWGQIIYDFGKGTKLTNFFIKTVSGETKMILQRLIYNLSIPTPTIITDTEIYSLRGNYTGIAVAKSTNEVSVKYNNQNNSVEFQPTQMSDNFCLKLYNLEGKEIEVKQYGSLTNNKIILNTSSLPKGVYVYSLNEATGKIVIQ